MTDHQDWWVTERGEAWLLALQAMARGVRYPDAEWVSALLNGAWINALDEVLSYQGLSGEPLRAAVAELPAAEEQALLELQKEYTFLFISAYPHVPAPPYASAYIGERLLMGEPAEAAARAYSAAGLAIHDAFGEMPDHAAAEIEFLAWLGMEAIRAREADDSKMETSCITQLVSFLNEEVQPWIPEFCRRIEAAARLPFYRCLAGLLPALLTHTPFDTSVH